MNLRKKECPRQSIRGKLLKKSIKGKSLKKKLLKREEAQIGWVTGLFLVLFMAVFLYAALQLERYRAASLYLEDALVASNLASAIVDVEEYGVSNKLLIRDFESAFQRYKWAVRDNLNLNENWEAATGSVIQGQVRIVTYTVYNVSGQDVFVDSVDESGLRSRRQGVLGELTAPNGITIESTSVYSEIAFYVEGFPGVKVEARKGNLVDIVR